MQSAGKLWSCNVMVKKLAHAGLKGKNNLVPKVNPVLNVLN